jgi:hypothetical protein
MLTIKQFAKSSWLIAIAFGMYFITSIAYAAPATIKINMDNKLQENVTFEFLFMNKAKIAYQTRFSPGTSSKNMRISDDKIIDTNIHFSFFTDTGKQYPCIIVEANNSNVIPKTFNTKIKNNYTCQVKLDK